MISISNVKLIDNNIGDKILETIEKDKNAVFKLPFQATNFKSQFNPFEGKLSSNKIISKVDNKVQNIDSLQVITKEIYEDVNL